FGQQFGERFGAGGQCVVVGGDGFGFVVVGRAVCAGCEALGLAATVEAGVLRHDVGDFIGVRDAELASSPQARVLAHAVVGPAIEIPAQVEPVVDGKFEVFELADIYDPDAICSVFFGQGHLVP